MQFQGKLEKEKIKVEKENSEKPHFGGPNFLFKNLALLVSRYHGQLSSCTGKNYPILRNVKERRTNGRE